MNERHAKLQQTSFFSSSYRDNNRQLNKVRQSEQRYDLYIAIDEKNENTGLGGGGECDREGGGRSREGGEEKGVERSVIERGKET